MDSEWVRGKWLKANGESEEWIKGKGPRPVGQWPPAAGYARRKRKWMCVPLWPAGLSLCLHRSHARIRIEAI
jgi:hypothetical protein